MSVLSIPGFTNVGYRFHARDFSPIDVDLSDRTVLVTGGTGGLGLATARRVAGMGARTVVVGRDPQKLLRAEREIDGNVAGYEADLSLMTSIEDLAGRLIQDEPEIHVLVNNVGVLLPERDVTAEGIERTLATDLAGHFLLTNLLVPRLIESAPSRIINITSGGMYSEKIRPNDLQFERGEYKGSVAYARAKRGQVILTEMWAERLADTGVTVHVMHPGWAGTAGVEQSLPTFNKLMKPFLRTPEQGADTIVWLVTASEPRDTSGELWFDREIVPKHFVERTKETQRDRDILWDRLVELTGVDLTIEDVAG